MKRSPLVILFITVVIDLLGFGIILPLLPLYVAKFGGGPVLAGWMAASFSIMQFIFAPIWGRASDFRGRRPFILLSLAGTSLAWFCFGAATQLWMLFAARIAAGVLTAASISTPQAYIADTLPPEKRSQGMAMIGVAFGIGFAFGPWLGSWLGRVGGLSAPAYFVAALAAANFVWSWFALPESLKERSATEGPGRLKLFDMEPFRTAFGRSGLKELLTVFSVATFAFALMEATFTWVVYLRYVLPHHPGDASRTLIERDAASLSGQIFGIVGLVVTFTQGLVMSGKLARFGDVALLRFGALCLSVALFAIGQVAGIGWLQAASALLAFGNGMMMPALNSLISRAAGPTERGGVFGVQQGLGSLARILAPPAGTGLLQHWGIGTTYVVSGALMTAAFLLTIGLKIDAGGDAGSIPPAH